MRLETTSEVGDWLGGGLPRTYTEQTGTLFMTTSDRSTPGRVDFAEFSLQPVGPDYNKWFLLMVATKELGHELRVGHYTNAERASFATLGHPGLDIGLDGSGCNTISGNFELREVLISPAGVLERLDMTFEQRCENGAGLLRGRFAYDASGAPISFAIAPASVPALATLAVVLISLLLAIVGTVCGVRAAKSRNNFNVAVLGSIPLRNYRTEHFW